MAEIDPRRPGFGHLVEQVIAEKLQEVPVPRLRPCWILLKPDDHTTKARGSETDCMNHATHGGGQQSRSYSLRPLVYRAQFGQQAKETAVLHLLEEDRKRYLLVGDTFGFLYI